jgi:hypothetical protein
MRARNFVIAIALILVSSISFAQTHTVTSFLPTAASVNETVTITGTQFNDVTGVSFGGTPAESFVVESSSTITAVVANGSSGNVSVTKLDGTVSLAGFTYVLVPFITSLSPASGPTGTVVTITGTDFSSTPSNNIVFFGAGKAVVSAASTTELTVTVPIGATYDPVTVFVNGRMGFSAKPFLPTFIDGDGIISGTFGPATNVDASDSYSIGAAAGDLDGDGKIDYVVPSTANFSDPVIGVFRNTSTGPGNISFATRVDFATGSTSTPNSVAIGDLDGDGKPDVIVTLQFNAGVVVFRNTTTTVGTITFDTKQPFSTGANPYSVVIGDLDLDGKPDLAVANTGDDNVSVLRNMSTGVGNIDFATSVPFTTADEPIYVAIGDLDGDGKSDLAVACTTGGVISVLRNNSDGKGDIAFDAKQDYTFTQPYAIAIGDFNQNGTADLAVVGNQGHIGIFRYNGTGPGNISYAAKVDLVTGFQPNRRGNWYASVRDAHRKGCV